MHVILEALQAKPAQTSAELSQKLGFKVGKSLNRMVRAKEPLIKRTKNGKRWEYSLIGEVPVLDSKADAAVSSLAQLVEENLLMKGMIKQLHSELGRLL